MNDEAMDDLLRDVAATLRAPGAADRALEARLDRLDERVMAAITAGAHEEGDGAAELPAHPPARHAPWLLRPRTVRVSPLAAFATAAALLIAAVVGAATLRRPAPAPATVASATPATPAASVAAPRDTIRLVQFVLLAPRASRVELVGDFNHWQGATTPLRRASAAGLWAVELPLPPGRYTYTFVVDGSRFTPDPAAPRAMDDDFGTPSSVITVAGSHT